MINNINGNQITEENEVDQKQLGKIGATLDRRCGGPSATVAWKMKTPLHNLEYR